MSVGTLEHPCTLLTPRQVAHRLGVSIATFRRHVRSGSLPAYQLGPHGAVRLDWDEVRDWLRGQPEEA